MSIGGYDYLFFSILPYRSVLAKFKKNISENWSNPYIRQYKTLPLHNAYEKYRYLSFSKDIGMYKKFIETDFFIDEQGEGTFSFICNEYQKYETLLTMTDETYKGYSKQYNGEKSAYFAKLFCPKMNVYTLVLHEKIETSRFSNFVYSCLLKALDDFVIEVKHINY